MTVPSIPEVSLLSGVSADAGNRRSRPRIPVAAAVQMIHAEPLCWVPSRARNGQSVTRPRQRSGPSSALAAGQCLMTVTAAYASVDNVEMSSHRNELGEARLARE